MVGNNNDNNNDNNNVITFAPVVEYQDNPILKSVIPTGVLGIDTNLGKNFKVRSMLDAINTLKQDELIGDLEVNAMLGDLGITGYIDNEKNKNLDVNYNDGTLSGQFTDFEDQKNLGIGFSKDGYTGNINTDFENTNASVSKTIDNPFGLKGDLTFGADTDFDKNKNIGFQYGMSFEDGGRVNYNQGSNWWDTLNDQGMNVYNSMKRGGHDDATIQSQLAMLGYYDPNSAQPDPTPDPTPDRYASQNQGGDNFSPYNPDPNTLKNFNENYNLNFNKKNNQQLSTLRDSIRANSALNEMNIDNPFSGEIQSIENMGYDDMMPNITTANQQNVEEEEGLAALARKKFGNILSFVGGLAIPGLGPLKSGLNAIGNTLPTNKRYIMENELMGSGFNINDIGQIVSDGGDYDDPSGKNVMAGYNAYKVNADTFAKRRAMINAKMSPKNKVKRLAALDAAEKIFNDSKKISNAVIKQKDNNQGNGGNGGGGGGGGFNSDNSTGYDSGNFCFDPSTPIQMFDGSTKEIKNIQLG